MTWQHSSTRSLGLLPIRLPRCLTGFGECCTKFWLYSWATSVMLLYCDVVEPVGQASSIRPCTIVTVANVYPVQSVVSGESIMAALFIEMDLISQSKHWFCAVDPTPCIFTGGIMFPCQNKRSWTAVFGLQVGLQCQQR